MAKYKGVRKGKNRNGRVVWIGKFTKDKVHHHYGMYETERDCAIAHDMYVLRKGIDRRTNILKKKLI